MTDSPMDTPKKTFLHRGGCWPWVALILGCIVILVVAVFWFLGPLTPRGVASKLDEWVDKISGRTVEQTFTEHVTHIAPEMGGKLMVARMESVETLTRKSHSEWLGTTEAEIRVPAIYTFYIRLDDKWSLKVVESGDLVVCQVVAPPLRAEIPPGIDTTRMERQSSSGWARFDKDDVEAELLSSLSGQLNGRAVAKVPLAREQARVAVEDFVRKWLARSSNLKHPEQQIIQVRFSDEPERHVDPVRTNVPVLP